MRILLIAGSPRRDSRTRRLLRHALEHARREHDEHDLDFLDLRDEAPEPFRGFDEEYDESTREVIRRVERADVILVGSPVFNGSYSAAVKNVFEHVNYKALEGRVAGFVLVGGGDISFLQVRSHLAQLMAYFNVHVVPRAVYATREDVEEEVPREIARRIERLVDAAVKVRAGLLQSGAAPTRREAAAASRRR